MMLADLSYETTIVDYTTCFTDTPGSNLTMSGRTMGTITKKNHWYKRLLLMAAVLTGTVLNSIPQHNAAAENAQEKVQEQEAKTIMNQAVATWQNFMQDPDLSGFRAHVK
jgi:hypothetical protein